MAMRRIKLQGLSRGFNGWLEAYFEYGRQKRILTRAAARMHRPKLSGAFHEWQAVLEEASLERERAALGSQLSAEAAKVAEIEKDREVQRLLLEDQIERARTEFETKIRKV